MAIELPSQVVWFLQHIGVNWPTVNEDKVREFATHVREFGTKLEETHQDSTATVKQLADVYQGASYEALLAKWAQLSDGHMTEMIQACHVVADALDIGADVIVAMKVEVIAELVILAATFVADQAAAVATLGLAEAAVALIIKAAEELVDYLVEQLEQYIIGQVIEAAIDPLVEVVSRAVGGLMFQAAESALGVSADGPPAGTGFEIHHEVLTQRAELMHGHAEKVAGHAEMFRTNISGVSFE
ncbi:WXG100 family type VII secretion target [Streptomyces sp. NPDC050738]|uniref:WXG100-like domain-containing protein n=1 Tax=Streptomyces sp. NPDC050738 TaxID=3154744 RepID=UPI0034146A7D